MIKHLRGHKFFYSLRYAFAFSMLLFFTELLFSGIAATQQLPRIKGIFHHDFWIMTKIFMPFIVRVFFLHLFFAFILAATEMTFGLRTIKKRLCFYFLVLFYFSSHNLLYNPQIFSEIGFLTNAVRFLVGILNPQIVYCFGIGIIGFLNFHLIRSKACKVGLLFAGVANLFLLFYLFYFQNPLRFQTSTQSIQQAGGGTVSTKSKPHVIIISIDSLRSDVKLEEYPLTNDAVKTFLEKSTSFERVIVPMAQTHGSFISLFSAEIPPLNGFRYALSARGEEHKALYKNSPLQILKEAGYQIKLLGDGHEFHYFPTGKFIDSSMGPEPGIKSLVLPSLFRNWMIFGLFNNPIGFFFIPEIRSNSAYSFAYQLPYFTEDTKKELRLLAKSEKPTVFLIHTCALHWPGEHRYPYYDPAGFPQRDDFAQYSYTSKHANLEKFAPPLLNREKRKHNKKIYDFGVRRVVSEFLNPIFMNLYDSGLLDQSIVLLMSDHGEDIRESASFPDKRTPHHAGSLLFDYDSERSFLKIKWPQYERDIAPRKIDSNISSIDLLPTLLEYLKLPTPATTGRSVLGQLLGHAKENSYQYVETSYWPDKNFARQLVLSGFRKVLTFFKLRESGLAVINPIHESGIILQKQRAVYKSQYRLTVYPTYLGYESFLCNLAIDPHCTVNQISNEPSLYAELIRQFDSFSKTDIEKSLFVSSHEITSPSLPSLEELKQQFQRDPDNLQWRVYHLSKQLAYRWHDSQSSITLLKWLAENESVMDYVRDLARLDLLIFCSDGIEIGKMQRDIELKDLENNLLNGDRLFSRPRYLKRLITCLNNQKKESSEALKELQNAAKSSPFAAYQLDSLNGAVPPERIARYLEDEVADSRSGYWLATHLYRITASLNPNPFISIFKSFLLKSTGPNREQISKISSIEQIKPYLLFVEDKKTVEILKQYGLGEELQLYDQARNLDTLFETLEDDRLPPDYFYNFLLKDIDDLDSLPSHFRIANLRTLRLSKIRATDFKEHEYTLGFLALENHTCAQKKMESLCIRARRNVLRRKHSQEWKRLLSSTDRDEKIRMRFENGLF